MMAAVFSVVRAVVHNDESEAFVEASCPTVSDFDVKFDAACAVQQRRILNPAHECRSDSIAANRSLEANFQQLPHGRRDVERETADRGFAPIGALRDRQKQAIRMHFPRLALVETELLLDDRGAVCVRRIAEECEAFAVEFPQKRAVAIGSVAQADMPRPQRFAERRKQRKNIGGLVHG